MRARTMPFSNSFATWASKRRMFTSDKGPHRPLIKVMCPLMVSCLHYMEKQIPK